MQWASMGEGRIPIQSADGTEYEVRNRATLCRCGRSHNKPFCDGTHLYPFQGRQVAAAYYSSEFRRLSHIWLTCPSGFFFNTWMATAKKTT